LKLLLLIVSAFGCSGDPKTLDCRRTTFGLMAVDDGMALKVESSPHQIIDSPADYIEVALLRRAAEVETIDLVQVIDGEEFGRWSLSLPRSDQPVVRCVVPGGGGAPSCGARLSDLPHPLHGYFYLQPSTAVIEAGLSAHLCR
jgi:hypothetical protein